MKIIKVDNFDRESVSDTLIATNISNYYAKLIAALLNEKLSGTHFSDFYRVVEDDYKLYEFTP